MGIEKYYTISDLISYCEKKIKGECTILIDDINSSLQQITTQNILWFCKQTFTIAVATTDTKTSENVFVKRLPENMRDITFAWISGRREPTDIITLEAGERFVNNTCVTVNCSKIWVIGNTYLTDDFPSTASTIVFTSSSIADENKYITIRGKNEKGYLVDETIALNAAGTVETTNTYSNVDIITKDSAFTGTLTAVANLTTTILDTLPPAKRLFSSKKINIYPVTSNETINFVGVKRLPIYANNDDIILDFPQEYLLQTVGALTLMRVAAWDKDSSVYQDALTQYTDGMKAILRENNFQLSRELKDLRDLQGAFYSPNEAKS